MQCWMNNRSSSLQFPASSRNSACWCISGVQDGRWPSETGRGAIKDCQRLSRSEFIRDKWFQAIWRDYSGVSGEFSSTGGEVCQWLLRCTLRRFTFAMATPSSRTATETAQPAPSPVVGEFAPEIEGHPFKAVADLSELDERARPAAKWTGRTLRLSRSHLVMQSRRMCHPGRLIVAAVHMVDAVPHVLAGTVSRCEYAGEGQYALLLELTPTPSSPELAAWTHEVAKALAKMAS